MSPPGYYTLPVCHFGVKISISLCGASPAEVQIQVMSDEFLPVLAVVPAVDGVLDGAAEVVGIEVIEDEAAAG